MKLRILGAMTGTSCDGLDAACIEIQADGWRPLWTASTPYPDFLRKIVLSLQSPGSLHPCRKWLELHRDLGNWYASSFVRMIQKNKPTPDLIANHGQTLAHFPEKNFKGMTLQMGDSTRIAAATGLSVISHFREGDMAAGGQGAPLVPLFHQMIASQLGNGKPGIAIHNLGGISNLTYLGGQQKMIAFDTGPGNIWIDAATQKVTRGRLKYDKGGRLSSLASPDSQTVETLLKHPYFSKPIPKSTGRDEFPTDLFFSQARGSGPALIATATAITVESIVRSYDRWIIKKGLPLRSIFFCGGGAKNLSIMNGLRKKLPSVEILELNEFGLETQYIEAQAFAVFGFMSLLGKPLGGKWTGARNFGPPGQITPGKNWPNILKKLML